ncbi:hypothetical protein ACSBR1_003694 [Camellia fascicularis]
MTVDWSHDISHVGQCFERGVTAFHLVLSKYAIECGFDFKFVKNDSVRVTIVCTLREQKRCTWLIHRRVQTCNGYFYLKRLNNLHNCGVVVCTGKNSRLNSELVCNVIGDQLHNKPLTRPTDVVFDLKKEYGLNVSYYIAWLGVEKAKDEVYDDYHYNPESYVNLDFEQSTSQFKRFFILFKSCIDGFNHIRPLFSARTLTFVSNRNAGLLESLPTVFPSAHHAYCLQHLQANLRNKLRWVDNRVRFGLMAKLCECAYAPIEVSFQHHLTKLKGLGRSGINNFLEDMPPKYWANEYFKGKRYGEMTSNAAESFNKWILDLPNHKVG